MENSFFNTEHLRKLGEAANEKEKTGKAKNISRKAGKLGDIL